MKVLQAVEDVNDAQKELLFNKFFSHYEGDIKGKSVALWGLSFKPETDDIREAPSLVLIDRLIKAGCSVRVFDPVAMEETKRRIGKFENKENVYFASDLYDAVLDVDALFVVTEWKEFRLPSWDVVKKAMKKAVVFDGRNIYEADDLKMSGVDYYCIGK